MVKNVGIMPPPNTSVKVTSARITLLPYRYFFASGYAKVSVKNIAVIVPTMVTQTDTINARGRVADEIIYL